MNRKIVAVFAMMLMIGTIFTSVIRAEMKPPALPGVEDRGASFRMVNRTEVWSSGTRILNESLVIANGGYLLLDRVNLIMNSTYDNELVIRVEKWGVLHVTKGSMITAGNPNWRYRFEVYGELLIDKSTVSYAGGGDPAGGIRIYTASWGKVVFSNSIISNCGSSGIYCLNSTPIITNCTIRSNDGDGIYCKGCKGYSEETSSVSLELFFQKGWNMISLPVVPENTTVKSLFRNVPYYVLYQWNSLNKSYRKLSKDEHLEIGRGYLLFVLDDTLWSIAGAPVFRYTVNLSKGWNMVGSLLYDTRWTDAVTDPAGAVWNWTFMLDRSGNFPLTRDIRPGQGYWANASQNSTLSVESGPKITVIQGNAIFSNEGNGFWCNSSEFLMMRNRIYSNKENGIECESSLFTLMDSNTIFSNKEDGIKCASTTFTMSNSYIYNNSHDLVLSSNSHLTTLDSLFKKDTVQVNDGSKLMVNMTFGLRAINWSKHNVSNANVSIQQKDGAEVFHGTTDVNGMIAPQILTQYIQDASALTFKTPHTFFVEKNGVQNRIHIVMDAPQNVMIYTGGDSDLDGISDTVEDNNMYWFEGENHVYDEDQLVSDYRASKSTAACSQSDIGEIYNETFVSVPDGTYKYYVRARCNTSVGTPQLKLFVAHDATPLINSDTHLVTEEYQWYSTPLFITSGNIRLSAKDIAQGSALYVDKIVLARITTNFGQITDPLEDDTDNDWIIDGFEVRNATYWIEAEDYPLTSYSQQCVDDINASNTKALKCTAGNQGIIDVSLSLSPGEYVYYVRAKNETGKVGTVELKRDAVSLATFNVQQKYQWYSKNFTIASQGTYHFYAKDTSAVRPAVYVDKIIVAKLSQLLVKRFSDGKASKKLTFPPGGGYNNTASLLIPEDAVLTDATLELYGNSSEHQLTADAFTQSNPDIYGDKLVYQDNTNGDWDIWLYNITTGVGTQITTSTADQTNPAIYGNNIVWQDGGPTSPPPVIINPSFEQGYPGTPVGWSFESATGLTSLYVNTLAHSGSCSVGIQNLGGTPPPPMTMAYWRQQIPITSGIEYHLSTWVNFYLKDALSIHRADVGIIWYNQYFTQVGEAWSPGIYEVTSGWVLQEVTAVAPPTAVTAEIRLRFTCVDSGPSPWNPSHVYFDDVAIQGGSSSENWDIYLYDLDTSTEYQVTTNASAQINPDIYGNTLVWQDQRNGDWDIYKYDLSNGLPVNETKIEQLQVGVQQADQKFPAIDENKIVWQDNRWGNWDIFMEISEFSTEVYNVQEIQITRNLWNQQNPAISCDRIVWQDDRNSNWDIYEYDLSAGYERRITTDASIQENPAISGGKVVWQDSRNGNKDIYLFDFSSNREKRLTSNSATQENPAIQGEQIVWQDSRNGNPDIYQLTQSFTLDVGNNGNTDWSRSEVFVEPDITMNLAQEVNGYLAEHWKDSVAGFITLPLSIYSIDANNLTITNISFKIEYLIDPLDADTDGDGLGDGREIYGFFGSDILEAEDAVEIHEWRNPYADYTDPQNGDPSRDNKVFKFEDVNFIHQTGVTLTSSNNLTNKEGYRDSWITLRAHIDDTGTYKLKVNPVLDEKENLSFNVGNIQEVVYKYVSEYAYYPVVLNIQGENIRLNESTAQYLRKVIANATYVDVEKESGGAVSPKDENTKENVLLSDIRFGNTLAGIQTKDVLVSAGWDYTAVYNFTRNTDYKITIGLDLRLVPPELRPPNGAEVPENLSWDNVSLARILDVDCIRVEKQTLDPLNIDADNDTLLDGFEATDSLYPLNPDADGDGLNDAVELFKTHTTLGYRDSDYDGIRDAVELGWNKTKITSNHGEVYSQGSWRERIAHWGSAYNYTAINNWDANTSTTTNPLKPDTDNDGIPDGWCDGWTYQSNPIDALSVKTYQKNSNMFKDVNFYKYDQKNWKFGGVMDCLVQIWEGEDLNLDGARDAMTNWGFNGVTYEHLSTTTGETDPTNKDTDHDNMSDGYEVWYSHIEPCVLSYAGTPLDPRDDIYFLDPNKDDARLDKDVASKGKEIYNQSMGNNWFALNGMGVYAVAQKINVAPPLIYNISKISVHLDMINAPKARMEIWSMWPPPVPGSPGKPFAYMATVDDYGSEGDGWYTFDVPDTVFRTSNDFGNPLPGYFIVMRWITAPYNWRYIPGGGLPGDTFIQNPSGNWIQTNDAFDYILLEDVYLGDNLTNLEEYIVGTNPKNCDTDDTKVYGTDDGLTDGEEVGYKYQDSGSITVINQGFEGVFPPERWSINNGGDNPLGNTWMQISSPHTGAYAAVCERGESYEMQEEWLISNPIYLSKDDNVQLHFWQYVDEESYEDYAYVLISTTGTEPADFTVLREYPPGSIPLYWVQSPPINLSSFKGKTIRLAWQYEKSSGSYGQNWFIDDVKINGTTTFSHNRGGVIFRTNVADGAMKFDHYGASGSWINYDGDGKGTIVQGRNYSYEQTLTNPSTSDPAASKKNILLFTLDDKTTIYLNSSYERIYVWSPNADLKTPQLSSGPFSTYYYEGTCHVYHKIGLANMDSYGPSLPYRNQEIYLSDPLKPDTDGDGLVDGIEIKWNENCERNNNGNLIEADTLINVRDTDSDDDGAVDGYEVNWSEDMPWDTDPLHLPNMIDADSDGDGIKDGNESMWYADTDGDGLANMIDRDSDNDGLFDGWNDSNGNLKKDGVEEAGEDTDADGINEANEPSPIKYDTDSDGLWDGKDINVTTGYSSIQGEHLGEQTVHTFTGQTTTTNALDWDSDNDTLSDGQEVRGYTIRVRYYNNSDKLVQVYSNPTAQFSDSDLLRDDVEYRFSNASDADTDHDGLIDDKEDRNHNGCTDLTETSPVNGDTDSDGLIDGNINNPSYPGEDRDNDGVLDNNEPNPLLSDSDGDKVNDRNEYWALKNHTGSGYHDSDNDGLIDLREYDSDNDGLSDGKENFDHNDEINLTTEADPTNYDTDADYLLDGAEPQWRIDSDYDGKINVRDNDSNDDTYHDYDQVYVVFRTNATDNDGDGKLDYASGTWIAVDPTGANLSDPSTLSLWGYSWSLSGISSINGKRINISFGPGGQNPIPVITPEGYDVYVQSDSSNIIYIKIGATFTKYTYSGQGDTGKHPIPWGSPSIPNYIAQHQETYDGRPALGTDSDFDGLSNYIENKFKTDPMDADSDDDGVKDGDELGWNNDTDKDGRINALDGDADNDGVHDGTEMGITSPVPYYGSIKGTAILGNYTKDLDPSTVTNPLNPDTDGDGLTDGAEDKNKNGRVDSATESDPNDKDTDDDGLDDGLEENGYTIPGISGTIKTSAINPDSDGDGIFDGTEAGYTQAMTGDDTNISRGHFIEDMDPWTKTNPADDDTDDDGITDGNEDRNKNGRRDGNDPTDTNSDWNNGAGPGETDPTIPDTDNDGLTDGLEIGLTAPQGHNTSSPPWNSLPGYGPDNDSSTTTDPLKPDSDNDGITDGTEDRDKDGERDGNDPTDLSSDWNNGVGPGETDPTNHDTDGDGAWDGLEVNGWDITILWELNFTVKEIRHRSSDPLTPDTDSDGLTDGQELSCLSDPTTSDSDGDRLLDASEWVNGSESVTRIEANPPRLTKAEMDVRIDYVQTLVEVISWIPIVGKIVDWVTKDIPSGLYIECTIEAEDDAGVDYIWVKVDGESAQKQYGSSFYYLFSVDYDLYFLKGWNIDVEAMDFNGNKGKPIRPFHIDGLADKLYDLLNLGLYLFLQGLGVDFLLDFFPDTDKDGLKDPIERACFLNPRYPDVYWLDIMVGFDWDLNILDKLYWVAMFRGAANFMFDVTDGHIAFGSITFISDASDDELRNVSNITVWSDAQKAVRVCQMNTSEVKNGKVWPHTYAGGEAETTAPYRNVFLPSVVDIAPTITHELGHYYLWFGDEYCDSSGNDLSVFETPPTFMNNQMFFSEMSVPWMYLLSSAYHKTDQYDEDVNNDRNPDNWSCFETMFYKYFTEPEKIRGAVEGKDYIWFDMEHDGVPDYSVPKCYLSNPGPIHNVGRYIRFHGDIV